MGGGDLNTKKSWHPNTMKNQERVWKAEQAAAEEKKRIVELQRERAEERDLAQLKEMAQRNFGSNSSPAGGDNRLHWMYDKPDRQTQQEDYLLGKAIGKNDDSEAQQGSIPALSRRVVGSSMTTTGDDTQVDLTRKLREDPLLLVKERERAARAALLNNPLQRKKLTELLRKEQDAKMNKSKKKSKKKGKDLDDVLAAKLNALAGNKGIDLTSLLKSDDSSDSSSDDNSKSKKKKKKRKDSKKKTKKPSETDSESSGDEVSTKKSKKSSKTKKDKKSKSQKDKKAKAKKQQSDDSDNSDDDDESTRKKDAKINKREFEGENFYRTKESVEENGRFHKDANQGFDIKNRYNMVSSPKRQNQRADSPQRKKFQRNESPPRRRDQRDESPPRRRDHRDESPQRRRDHRDESPQIRRDYRDESPPRWRDYRDESPPRRRNQRDESPPRRRNQRDESPPRKRGQRNDSPPTKTLQRYNSPPRRRDQREDSQPRKRNQRDDSPPRRRDQRNDSPPRKKNQRDESPTRRRDQRDDSPPRKRDHRDESPTRRRDQRDLRNDSPPRRRELRDVSPSRRRDDSPPRRKDQREDSPPKRRDQREDSPPRKDLKRASPSKNFNDVKRKKPGLSEEEKAARLAEMMAAGAEREVERGTRVARQRAEDAAAAARAPMPPRQEACALPDSLESRIRSNRHYIQRDKLHMNEHFARR